MDTKELFEKITGLTLKQVKDFYDEEYGHYKYEVDSSSLLIVLDKVLKFNIESGRIIKPQIENNKIYVYL